MSYGETLTIGLGLILRTHLDLHGDSGLNAVRPKVSSQCLVKEC